MLKKYTKYVATAFAVASLSTFMIGCGAEEDAGEPAEDPVEMPEGEGDPNEGTEDEPAETKPDSPLTLFQAIAPPAGGAFFVA